MAYESFVGARYLMAKQRSRVVSIITLIAVGGVGLGVTALIVVLSVMGGFTEDLTGNILGARAHVVIQDAEYGLMPHAEEVADRALEFEGVVGASPVIDGEVMVSSRTNLSGVVLRGVDVDRVVGVSDLLEDITAGQLEYLRDDTGLKAELEEPEEERFFERFFDQPKWSGTFGPPGAELEPDGGESPRAPAAPMGSDAVIELPEMHDEVPPAAPVDGDEEEPVAPMEVDDEIELPAIDEESPAAPMEADDDIELPTIDEEEPVAPMEVDVEDTQTGEEDELEPPKLPTVAMPPMFEDEAGEIELPELPVLDEGVEAPTNWETSAVPGLIIGAELANSLRVGLGDEVTVVTPRGDLGPTGPMPRSRPFQVVGIFRSGLYEYDASHAYTAIGDAGRLFDYHGATGIDIRAEDVDDSVAIAENLDEALGDQYQVLDWQEMNSSLFFALRLERIAMFIVLTFIILVASFSIVAMLIMIVIEKGREIAILKSMGATDGGIMRIFMFQGLVIGVLGALLGLGAGLGICYYLERKGIPLDTEIYYISTIPVDVNPTEVAAVVACAVFISFLATLYPSYKAARLNPVEGLSYD